MEIFAVLFHSLFQLFGRNPAIHQQSRPRRHNGPTHGKTRVISVPRLECLEDRTVPSYIFHTIDDPGRVSGSSALGINSRGQVVGNYVDANSVTHGFLLSHGHFTDDRRAQRDRRIF